MPSNSLQQSSPLRTVAFPMITRKRLATMSDDSKTLLTAFGLTNAATRTLTMMELPAHVTFEAGQVLLVTGPSGSGKTTAKQLLASAFRTERPLATGTADRSKPLIESWETPPARNVERLTRAGLGDPFTWCRTFDELSDGQKARYELADLTSWKDRTVIIDEFCNSLDRITARAVAWSAAKTIRQRNCQAIFICNQTDIIDDLSPDFHIETNWQGVPKITERAATSPACTLLNQLHYRPGQPSDWQKLKVLHYAAGDPATRHSIHVLDHPDIDHPAAVALLSYPDMHSQGRNVFTNDRYQRNANVADTKRLNEEVKRLSRIVVAPELRNCGIARTLIEHIVSTVPMRYLECSTQLGRFNRFLESAGFVNVPQPHADAEANLRDLATTYAAPSGVGIDPAELHEWCERLSVRKRRDFRRAVWLTYHHYKLHRRTRSRRPAKVADASDPRWSEAFDLAAQRLEGRPAYWIREIPNTCS